MEFCHACNLEIANSFFDYSLSKKQALYFDIGEYIMNDVNHYSFAQLNVLLGPRSFYENALDCFSSRLYALASHYFLILTQINIELNILQHVKYSRYNFHFH